MFTLLNFMACEASIPEEWVATFDLESFPYEEDLRSKGVFVIDMESGAVGLAVNENKKMMGASTIKIMTALVILEELGEEDGLDQSVEVPEAIYAGFNTDDPNTVGSSLSGIALFQDTLTYRDCLYALMMRSGNEAANILAYNLTAGMNSDVGSFSKFAEMMNDKAAEIGCVNTRFANAHGLHEEGNWTTAHDLAKIAQYAYEKYPLFRDICNRQEYRMPSNYVFTRGYRIQNGNALVRAPRDSKIDDDDEPAVNIYYRDYAQGVKNGALDVVWYRDDDGEWAVQNGIANLVSIGSKGGKTYLVVTLEAPYKTGGLLEGQSRLHYAHVDHLLIYDEWLFAGNDERFSFGVNDS